MMDREKLKNSILTALVFMFFAGIYISSVAPAYNSDDSPETTLAFHTLGIQHPPGYPLNTMLGKVFTLIPAGGLMMRANMMSAFFNLLAGFMIFLLVYNLLAGRERDANAWIAGLLAAALFMFSATPWLQSAFAKGSIYALNAFLTAACLWAMLKMRSGRRYFYLFCYLYGLSLGNHWTSMAALAPAVLFYIYTQRKSLNMRALLAGAAFAAFGAGVYLYVFVRNGSGPVYAWGDTKTLKDFIWLISRAQYAGVEVKHTAANTLNLLGYSFGNLFLREYPLLLAALFLPGVAAAYVRKKNETLALFACYAFLTLSVASVATPPAKTEWLIKPYLVSCNIFVSVFMAVCLYAAARKLATKYSHVAHGAAAAAILLAALSFNNPHYDRYFIGYDFSKNLSMTVGEGSIILTEGDMNIGAVLYETLVAKAKYTALIPVVLQYEWYRRQATHNYPGMFVMPPNNQDMTAYLRSILAANQDRKIYYSDVFTRQWLTGIQYYPEGIAYKLSLTPGIRPVSDLYLRLYSFRGIVGDRSGYDEFTQRLVLDNYAGGFMAFADTLRDAKNLPAAIEFYRFGLLFGKTGAAYINLGLAYYYTGDLENAKKEWQSAIDLDPKNSLAYSNMAFVYVMQKDYPLALRYANLALTFDPANPTALRLKAQLTGGK
jgi:tetratricopeptide (TPR) repeat protein